MYWGADPPDGMGQLGGVVFAFKCIWNSKSYKNGNINYTIYIPTDIVSHQQYISAYVNNSYDVWCHSATALINDAPVA